MSTVHSKNKNDKINTKDRNMKPSAVSNTWLKAVIEEKKFNVTKIIDTGFVRAFLSIILPGSSKEVLVTVWKDDYIESRLLPWMDFKNKNVMPLLHLESITNLNAVLTYTVPGKSSLQERVNNPEYRNHNEALNKIMMNIMDTTNGLQYIHEMGYAHMNIKATTVTVHKEDTLRIDNFQFLTPTNITELGTSIIRNGLQQSLCPPETFYDQGNGYKYLKQFDSWAVGIMIIELCTGEYLKKKLPKYVDSWCLQVYPVLYKILKKKKFEKEFQKSFPNAHPEINLRDLRILAANILSLHPCNRPTISDIHKTLSNLVKEKDSVINTETYKDKPKIWKRKLHWSKLMTETARMALEEKTELDKKLEKSDQCALNTSDSTESIASGYIMYKQDNFTQDDYMTLREEILKYYGERNLHVSVDEGSEIAKVFPSTETNTSCKNEEGFAKKEEFVKKEKNCEDYRAKVGEGFVIEKETVIEKNDCQDCSTKLEENNVKGNTRTWSRNIFSKLNTFGEFTLKYLTDEWRPENSDSYLNKLSKRLTG